MSRQDYFDRALAGLRSQGKLSLSLTGACMYRAPDGCRCAIGWLIPDVAYREGLEGKSATSYSVREAVGSDAYQNPFLFDMQSALHDSLRDVLKEEGSHFTPLLEFSAETFAHKWGLLYTPPEGNPQ